MTDENKPASSGEDREHSGTEEESPESESDGISLPSPGGFESGASTSRTDAEEDGSGGSIPAPASDTSEATDGPPTPPDLDGGEREQEEDPGSLPAPTGDTDRDAAPGELADLPSDAIEAPEPADAEQTSDADDADRSGGNNETLMGGYQARNVDAPEDETESIQMTDKLREELDEAASESTAPQTESDQSESGGEEDLLEIEDDLIIEEGDVADEEAAPAAEPGEVEEASVVGTGSPGPDSDPDAPGEDRTTGLEGLAGEMESADIDDDVSAGESTDSGTVEEPSAPDPTSDAPTVADASVGPPDSGGLEDLADEMERTEADGDSAFGEADLDTDEEGISADDFEHDEYEETVISEEGFEGAEFDGEKTQLTEPGGPAAAQPPLLEILEGPAAGREAAVESPPVTVGRSSDNDVTIHDEAISRNHLEIREGTDRTYTVADLDSANGTELNGRGIDEAELYDGDRIEVGESVFQFTVREPTPDRSRNDRHLVPDRKTPARTHEPRHTTQSDILAGTSLATWLDRITVAGVGVAIAMGVMFVVLLVAGVGGPSAEVVERNRSAQTAFLSGVEATRSGDWETAKEKFETARSKDPSVGPVDEWLERVQSNYEARQTLDRARKAFRNGETSEGKNLADEVPESSHYHPRARALVRHYRSREQFRALLQSAGRHLEEGTANKALAAVRRILDRAPNHREALAMRYRIVEETDLDFGDVRDRLDDENEASAALAEASTDEESPEETSRWAPGSVGSEADDPGTDGSEDNRETEEDDLQLERGLAYYNQGQFSAAIDHFDSIAEETSRTATAERASRLADQIRHFRNLYRVGQRRMNESNWQKAIAKFQEALDADAAVATARYFQGDVNEYIARAHARRGEALLESGKRREAFRAYKKSRQYDRDNSESRSLLDKLERKAEDLYIKAKAAQKRDPTTAKSLCRKILSIVPKGHPTYEKAEGLLDDL